MHPWFLYEHQGTDVNAHRPPQNWRVLGIAIGLASHDPAHACAFMVRVWVSPYLVRVSISIFSSNLTVSRAALSEHTGHVIRCQISVAERMDVAWSRRDSL